jgi:hypothetical protein
MSLSQPSRTIVVEPVQVPVAAPAPPAPAEKPPVDRPERVEAPATAAEA